MNKYKIRLKLPPGYRLLRLGEVPSNNYLFLAKSQFYTRGHLLRNWLTFNIIYFETISTDLYRISVNDNSRYFNIIKK